MFYRGQAALVIGAKKLSGAAVNTPSLPRLMNPPSTRLISVAWFLTSFLLHAINKLSLAAVKTFTLWIWICLSYWKEKLARTLPPWNQARSYNHRWKLCWRGSLRELVPTSSGSSSLSLSFFLTSSFASDYTTPLPPPSRRLSTTLLVVHLTFYSLRFLILWMSPWGLRVLHLRKSVVPKLPPRRCSLPFHVFHSTLTGAWQQRERKQLLIDHVFDCSTRYYPGKCGSVTPLAKYRMENWVRKLQTFCVWTGFLGFPGIPWVPRFPPVPELARVPRTSCFPSLLTKRSVELHALLHFRHLVHRFPWVPTVPPGFPGSPGSAD